MRNEYPRKAISLKYDKNLPAPFVTAKGTGILAERMKVLAETSEVPVLQMEGLIDELFIMNPGEMIPEYLFSIVAEIFAFIYSVQESE